jgi:flagellar hook-associated protein 3 FlgL
MRVTSNMMGDNLINIIKRNAERMSTVQDDIAVGKKNRIPRENPAEVAQGIAYNRVLFELERFEKNIEDGKSRIHVADAALESVTDVLQRIRELAVQGSNGIYTREDRAKIGVEVEELLKELVAAANTKYKGKAVFAGNDTLEDPFKTVSGFNKFAGKEVIDRVDYWGDMGKQNREIERETIMSVNLPGNEVFWAENASLFSAVDATNYIVAADSMARINGVEVGFKAGDNIEMIVNRINGAPVPLRASVNRMNGGIILETSSAREIWVEDIEGGSVMQDIGVVSGKNPPKNLSPEARVFGGTIFDMVMRLRDSLFMNNAEDVGGSALGGVDLALDNLLKNRAELGAKESRLDMVQKRVIEDRTSFEEILSKTEDVDVAEAITKFKMLEATYRSALGVSARIIQPTLLDFLR